MEACGLDDVCVAECEGVGQAGPGFKAPNASAASAPAADGSFSRIVGGRNAALLKEQAIRGPIITQAEQEFLQTSQGVHGLVVNTWWDLDLAVELVNPVPAVRR